MSRHSDQEMYGADGYVGTSAAPALPNPTPPPPPPPPYAAPYVVQYPGGTIRWSTGLCHCTDDPVNCKCLRIQLPFHYLFYGIWKWSEGEMMVHKWPHQRGE